MTYIDVLKESTKKLQGARRAMPEDRRNAMLHAAIELAKQHGYQNLTRQMIGQRAGVAPTLLYRYFKSVKAVKRLVMKAAVSNEIHEIVAQGLAAKDVIALRAPDALKEQSLKTLYH